MSGNVRVELGSAANLPSEILGRQPIRRKSLFQIIAQLWRNPAEPEVRNVANYRPDPRIGTRGTGSQTRIYLQDVSAVLNKYRTATIEAGQFFGESAALGRTPRQATVFAERSTQLLEIRWQGLRDLMRRDDGLQKHIDAVFRERALKWFLMNTPIFQHLGAADISTLVAEAKFESHGQYDWAGSFKQLAQQGIDTDLQHESLIAEEGNHPNGVIIVRSGLARLSRRHEHGHRTIGYLTPGQIFGLDEIIGGWLGKSPKPLANSLRAIGIANVVTIPTRLIET